MGPILSAALCGAPQDRLMFTPARGACCERWRTVARKVVPGLTVYLVSGPRPPRVSGCPIPGGGGGGGGGGEGVCEVGISRDSIGQCPRPERELKHQSHGRGEEISTEVLDFVLVCLPEILQPVRKATSQLPVVLGQGKQSLIDSGGIQAEDEAGLREQDVDARKDRNCE